MGFDVNRFIECSQINEDLICNICKGVLEEALWAPNCEHAFCRVCINKWLERRNICPNDRQQLSRALLKPIPRFMRNILDKLDIKCDFAANGCSQVIPLETLRQHISVCDFNPEKRIECDSGCGLVIKKADLQSHNCVKALRKTVNSLVEENLKFDRMLTSVRFDINGFRNENKRLNDSVISLQNDVKRLSVERQDSTHTVISEGNSTQMPLSSTTLKPSDRNSRVVPNPYVLITPLQSSSMMGSSDEPSSSSALITPSNSRLLNEEPVFKRRTAIHVATPIPAFRPHTSGISSISSSIMRSFPNYTNGREDTYSSPTPSPRFVPNVTTLSPSNDSVSQDEESTTAITLSDGFSNSYNYITLDAEQDFDDNDETEPEDDQSIEQVDDYDLPIEVQLNEDPL